MEQKTGSVSVEEKGSSTLNTREKAKGNVWRNRASGTPGTLEIANIHGSRTTEGEKELGAGTKLSHD